MKASDILVVVVTLIVSAGMNAYGINQLFVHGNDFAIILIACGSVLAVGAARYTALCGREKRIRGK